MRPSRWADRLTAVLVRFVGLLILLATITAATASFLYNQRAEAEQAQRVAMQVNMRLGDQLAVLQAVRALYQSDRDASGPGIRNYLSALQPQVRAPGMQGIGIAIAMAQGMPAAAEAKLRENYGHDISVWPASDQPIGFPIVLIEPSASSNHVALGFDMYSDPVRRAGMRRAWQTGQPAASGLVDLVQERQADRRQRGFLIYIPVYADSRREGEAVATAPGFRPVQAFIYAPFRIDDLMEALLGRHLRDVEGIAVYAGEGPSATRVFTHGQIGWDAHDQRLMVADQRWTLRISYGRFIDRIGRPLGILLFGIALALLATQLHRVQQRRLGAFQTLAEERARHAEDRELMIGEMAHRMKNAFARIGALARITLRESNDLADFETRFDGRLRALSDAKQMLVTGAVGTVDLRAIVRRELELAGWSENRLAALTGPDVRLNDDGAQTISLALHEFVTNSVKYGALGGTGGLSIDWRRDAGDIQLCWVESDLATTPDIATESFGTQFIRSLIERQLKGSWRREAVDNRLSIVIRWPDDGASD